MNVSGMQTGLAARVRALTGLAQEAVRISNQNAGEPPAAVRSWVSLFFGDLVPRNQVDTVLQYPTPGTPAVGQEITIQAIGLRTLNVSVQAFTRDAAIGNAGAVAILANLGSKLVLPSSLAAFKAAGLALQVVGPVRELSALVNQEIQGRALLELDFEVVATAEEKVGYIETVSGTITVDDESKPFEAPKP